MPKPVLSDSLFNADDVATAVLAEANLQITNQDLGVVTITNLLTATSSVTIGKIVSYAFNGFVFVGCQGQHSGSPSNNEKLFDINTDYTPISATPFPTSSLNGDTSLDIVFNTNNQVNVGLAYNTGNSQWYFCFNGFYRFA